MKHIESEWEVIPPFSPVFRLDRLLHDFPEFSPLLLQFSSILEVMDETQDIVTLCHYSQSINPFVFHLQAVAVMPFFFSNPPSLLFEKQQYQLEHFKLI